MSTDNNRIRNKTIAFHVTEDEYKMITMLADISGMEKQEYLIARAMNTEFVVQPNIRVRHYLERYLVELSTSLQSSSCNLTEELTLSQIKSICKLISQL